MKKKILLPLVNALGFFMRAFRPLLGPPGVCLYPVNCMVYTECMLLTQPLHKAFFLIIFRLMRCNPLTGVMRMFFHKKDT